MTNTQKTTSETTMVDITLSKGPGRFSEDVHVIVNGNVFLVKRGESVKVPSYVADILNQQEAQLELAEKLANN